VCSEPSFDLRFVLKRFHPKSLGDCRGGTMPEVRTSDEEQGDGQHILTIHSPDICIKLYQTMRPQTGGLIAYYHAPRGTARLLELGKTLRLVLEQVLPEAIMTELQDGGDDAPKQDQMAYRIIAKGSTQLHK
jgi:hypothetical protein